MSEAASAAAAVTAGTGTTAATGDAPDHASAHGTAVPHTGMLPPPPPPQPRVFSHSPRERTPPEVREAREQEKELQRLDRDTRTVFAYNLSLKADERDLFDFFSEAGTVVDIRIICDRHTKRSKGFAYIEYEDRVRC